MEDWMLTQYEGKEKTMTVKEVATALNVSNDLVKKRIRELYPTKMVNGKTTYLNEIEVTFIKKRIEENSNLATYDERNRLSDIPKTALEKQLLIKQAMLLQDDIINDLQLNIKQLALENKEVKQELNYKNEVIVDITENVPTKTMRTMINQMIRASAKNFQERWVLLYKEFNLRYSINLVLRAKNRDMKTLDYVEEFGYMRQMYELAVELFEAEYDKIKHKFLLTINKDVK